MTPNRTDRAALGPKFTTPQLPFDRRHAFKNLPSRDTSDDSANLRQAITRHGLQMEHGFHVISDKPLTTNLQEAQELYEVYRQQGVLFALTHNYTGYPMVKEAKARIQAGAIETITRVIAVFVTLQTDILVTLSASQICVGEGNGFSIRVYGTTGSLKWYQQNPEVLHLFSQGHWHLLTRGPDSVSSLAKKAVRIPGGHPEGFIEAFANIYREMAKAVRQG